MKQTHLVVIMADQLRRDVLGKGYTPHIDSLAEEGVSFDNVFCASPLCVPARGSFFTGLCPNSSGSKINPWQADDAASGMVHKGIPNLYELMERDGFECIHSGKQHLFTEGGKLEDKRNSKIRFLSTEKTYREFLKQSGRRFPGGTAFRSAVPEMVGGKYTRVCSYSNAHTGCYEEGESYYFDSYFTKCALQGLRTRDSNRPLFLSAMFLAPHPPLDVPEPWYSLVRSEDVRLPDNVGKWYPYQSPLQLYNLTGVIGSHYTVEQWHESWRVYLGLVALLDKCVGRLLDELKRQGIYEDCLIVFTSDHGEMLGSHRLFQKMCMYEESAHVPLMFRFPHGAYAGLHRNDTISHLDVLPTILEYLHDRPVACEGKSLLPLIEGTEKSRHKDVYIQFDGNGALGNFQRCVIRDNYKLIADIFKDEVYFELYDIQDDPQETNNLIFSDSIPDKAEELLNSLLKHMKATNDALRLPNTNLKLFKKNYQKYPSQIV